MNRPIPDRITIPVLIAAVVLASAVAYWRIV